MWTVSVSWLGGAPLLAGGKLLTTVRFPCSNVTKLAFGGPDLRTAYVTTARHALDAEQRAEQPLAGGLFRFEVDVPGLPQGVLHV